MEESNMANVATKLPVTNENEKSMTPARRHPLATLQTEIDRLFNDFSLTWPFRRSSFNLEPFWQTDATWGATPAVDVVEKDKAYEITAELPGMDEKSVELKIAGDMLTITGEKQEEKEEKKKGYYLSERRFGSFQRSFRLPDDVDVDKIDASFRKGVLTVTMPRRPGVEKAEKKIAVKAA
jgi:HSP20 family protein